MNSASTSIAVLFYYFSREGMTDRTVKLSREFTPRVILTFPCEMDRRK